MYAVGFPGAEQFVIALEAVVFKAPAPSQAFISDHKITFIQQKAAPGL